MISIEPAKEQINRENLKTIKIKKALLFAILALSFNVFAQSKHHAGILQNQKISPIETIKHQLTDEGNMIPGIRSGHSLFRQTIGQQSSIQFMDSIYGWELDTTTSEWKLSYCYKNFTYDGHNNLNTYVLQQWMLFNWENYNKYTFTFDANNNLTSELDQDWDGSAWVNTTNLTYAYDASNNQVGWEQKIWMSSAWVNAFKRIRTFDANNNMTNTLMQNWVDGNWVNASQNIFTYDANNNQTSLLLQQWNGSAWENMQQHIFTYNANNNLLNDLRQYWNDSLWENFTQRIYTYDANNNQLSSLFQSADESGVLINSDLANYSYDAHNNRINLSENYWDGSGWVENMRLLWTYDANNNVLSELQKTWDGVAWVDVSRINYAYDANNNLTRYTGQNWNGSTWVTGSIEGSSYDANNFLLSETSRQWYAGGLVFAFGDSTYYYFHTTVGIDELASQDQSLSIYPNPSTGKFTISATGPISSVEIHNLTGERVYSDYNFSRATSRIIDLFASPKGIYLVKVISGEKEGSRKIVIR